MDGTCAINRPSGRYPFFFSDYSLAVSSYLQPLSYSEPNQALYAQEASRYVNELVPFIYEAAGKLFSLAVVLIPLIEEGNKTAERQVLYDRAPFLKMRELHENLCCDLTTLNRYLSEEQKSTLYKISELAKAVSNLEILCRGEAGCRVRNAVVEEVIGEIDYEEILANKGCLQSAKLKTLTTIILLSAFLSRTW